MCVCVCVCVRARAIARTQAQASIKSLHANMSVYERARLRARRRDQVFACKLVCARAREIHDVHMLSERPTLSMLLHTHSFLV